VNPLGQYVVCLIMATLNNLFGKHTFDREFFLSEDGGTMGIDWFVDSDGLGRPVYTNVEKLKPILILVPGLGEGS
jgi:hypothetical protein